MCPYAAGGSTAKRFVKVYLEYAVELDGSKAKDGSGVWAGSVVAEHPRSTFMLYMSLRSGAVHVS